MNQEKSDRRRDYTVNRPVQAIYVTTWLASIALLLVLAMLSYNCFQLNDRLQGMDVSVFGINGFALLSVLGAFLVIISLGLCVYAIVMTHRMLGSSYRIKTVLQEIRKGNWAEKANLREGDYFLDVAHELNSFIDEQVAKQAEGNTNAPQSKKPDEESQKPPESPKEEGS